VTEKKLYFPTADEEVLEVRKLIQLADYEGCIVRDKDGHDTFFFGKNASERSFFLPPHSQLVTLLWSRGRRRERRDLRIQKIDLRPMYMSFEFNCRTSDNVELILEGTFFWEVTDLKMMVQVTGDTSGDVCNHARSKFIEGVSKVTLQEFMRDFNKIAEEVHKGDDSFYKQRGVLIHSLEVSGYKCAEATTAQILEQIIQETTNRMNRLQQQESENEVQLNQIKGDIEEERARGELLTIQTENSNKRSAMEGLAEAERAKQFLNYLKSDVPDLNDRIALWNVLRKEDALGKLSDGNVKMFFTNSDLVSLEHHEHDDGTKVTRKM
jgi:regulator of protease activity HflC (stomatin/prohibitin superfamily)